MSAPAGRFGLLHGLILVAIAGSATWWASGRLTAPMLTRAQGDRATIADLRARLEAGRITILETQTLEDAAKSARSQLARLEQEIPAESAMIWLPDLVKTHFARFGSSVSIVRMNTVRDEPELPGFSRGYWSIALPIAETQHGAEGSLLAVAELEASHPFVKVLDFAIRPDLENLPGRVAILNLSALIRK